MMIDVQIGTSDSVVYLGELSVSNVSGKGRMTKRYLCRSRFSNGAAAIATENGLIKPKLWPINIIGKRLSKIRLSAKQALCKQSRFGEARADHR